jgi:hypothetical protein
VLCLPEQLNCSMIYIIVVPDMHGQRVDTENYQIAAAAPRASQKQSMKLWGVLHSVAKSTCQFRAA